MKVFVLIPVHNRAEMTIRCLHNLLDQTIKNEIEIIIIDDGSTDGTGQRVLDIQKSLLHLTNREITLIKGTGDWWWTKCIEVALDYVKPLLKISDSVLLLNDDVQLKADYLAHLLTAQELVGKCVVMSQLVNIENDKDLVISPVSVSSKNLSISAVNQLEFIDSRLVKSDVAPGRGTLYPAAPIIEGHNVNTKKLPHYIADYEFSARISRLGYPIVCALDALVFTQIDWGNTKNNGNIIRRLFAKESSDNILAHWTFWRTWSPELSQFFLFTRMLRYKVVPSVININKLGLRRYSIL
jgi:N-acetylglucosaminyl-diphospho-decaprenol L-rhamnosyltransferase